MEYTKVYFDNNDPDAFLEIYVPDRIGEKKHKAIMVIPGGGYHMVYSFREGEPIALAFVPYGFSAFVLHYSVKKKPFPSHLIQASKAMKHIKDNADLYNIDPAQVFTVGFSAGGHLAASLGTMWDLKEIYDEVDMPYGYNKPAGMILMYPVLTGDFYQASFKNLWLTSNPSEEQLKLVNIPNHICKDSSPAFILHTCTDEAVDVRGSLSLANALADQRIPFEMHIYPEAPHGVALGNEFTKYDNEKWCNKAISQWVNHAVLWMEGIAGKEQTL